MSAEKKIYMSTDYTGEAIAPHQYFVTDADGKPHWEDKLAYDENKVVEIIPPTEVGRIWYGYVEVDCPNSGEVKVGDAGVMYINGEPHKYTAIEQINLSGPPVIVQLDVEGVDTSLGKIGLNSSKKLVFHNIPIGSADTNNTISLTKESYTIKTIDPKYLPSGSGGGGVMYISGLESLIVPAYADAALTTMLSYDQAKEIIQKQFAVSMSLDGMQGSLYPVFALGNDTHKNANIVIISPGDGSATGITLTFSDTPES